MDEDDSQDELINHSTTQRKRKRAALWAISDDSDESEEGSEEGDSDSVEEDEEDHINGEEEEEEEDEDDDEEEEEEEEEEDIKAEGEAPGGTSADLGEMSSDEDAEKCPICLNSFTSQPVATPESCEHYFCFDCLIEWAKNSNSCPVDRSTFNNIYLRKCFGGKLKKVITVQKPVKEGQEEVIDLDLEQTNCEVCGGSDREDRLLLCDGCDAGYHMECLLPPLDSVPVEEWFCPECEANNRQSRNPDEEVSDGQSVPSTTRSVTRRSPSRTAGPTRAIARTQQSERVRASVNRNRITQARSSQLAPTYLIQSSWLDETINAVVAGLNTAVYVRDLTPRAPAVRRRKSGKRRKVRSKKTSSQGAYKKAGTSGVRRRKRRRRTKSKSKRKVVKKVPTPRSRIASNLGIARDKKSSLPTVYRPSENTLSNMRADIGAASLSIYGDPYDLEHFSDREEVEQQARIPSLLEAKRRGISRSALRSHQPVARPFTTGLSRRHVDVGPVESVVEAAPVPDLLGSILTGQSMLLMDSSDVVINRDGTLKSSKPAIPSALAPSSSKIRSSGEDSNPMSPGLLPSLPESSSILTHNEDILRPSNSISRRWSQSSSGSSSSTPFSSDHPRLNPHNDLPNRHRHTPSSNHHQTNRASLPMPDVSSTMSKTTTSSQAQNKKTPLKPMWEDVSFLPKIPKIKRENSGLTPEVSSRGSHSRSDGGSSSVSNGGRWAMPESSINSLSGDKGRQQSVDQPKSHTGGHTQRETTNRPNSSSSSSSSFSNSFSSSSHASQSRHAASSSSSSSSSSASVSFRINSSGNSWQSRRLTVTPSLAAAFGEEPHDRLKAKEEEVKNRQLHKNKKIMLASRTSGGKETDNIYDPFNPTASNSSSSDEEGGAINSHDVKQEEKTSSDSTDEKAVVQRSRSFVQTQPETEAVTVSQKEPSKTLKAKPLEVRCSQDNIKIKKESKIFEPKSEKQAMVFDVKVKNEQLDEAEESDNSANTRLNTERAESTVLADHRSDQRTRHEIKTEKKEKCSKSVSKEEDSRPSSSVTAKKKPKEETKPDVTHNLKSPQKDAVQNKKTSKPSDKHYSSSSESERGRRGDHCATGRGDKPKENETEKSSSSREQRRVRSSDSSQPNSPDRTRQKKRRSRSRSKDKSRRSRSRSASSSSSTERLKKNDYRPKSRKGDDGKEKRTKEKRRGRPRSNSRSRSRSQSRSRDRRRGSSRSKSRSRSRERRKDHTRTPHYTSRDNVASRSRDHRRHRSRSNSRERRKDGCSSNVSQKTSDRSVSSSKDVRRFQEKRKEKVIPSFSSIKVEKVSKVSQQEPRSSASRSAIKLEEKNPETTNKTSTVEMNKDRKHRTEIKKEKQTIFDMFEESSNIQSLKNEPLDTPPLTVKRTIDPEVFPTVKSESCDLNLDKSEPDIEELGYSPPTVTEPVQVSVRSIKQQNDEEFPVEVKKEKQQTSDYDNDLDVDMEIDDLVNVKCEQTEDGDLAVKPVKEVVEEEKKEERLLSASTGAKTKTQVKRVTWNIQEPEGPQPEKSESKVALYKKKLKQEGIRKPSLAIQTSTQDSSGNPVDLNKKAGDGSLTEELSAAGSGEPAEGDGFRKDKQYLKKLHMQERAVEEVKLAIKPYYQGREINKEEYKEILRKAVQKVCHSKSGEINPVKVGNLVKAYVDKYKHERKPKKDEESEKQEELQCDAMIISDSP